MKSYFASTVEAAMALARRELGPDAMLVQSRRATAETRRLGEYEVIFAVAGADADPAGNNSDAALAVRTKDGVRDEAVSRLSLDIADLKQQLERLAGAVSLSRYTAGAAKTHPTLNRILAGLIDADTNTGVAEQILEDAQATGDLRRENLEFITQQHVGTDPTLGIPDCERNIVAVVGPPGAGKTTTLVKLAAAYGLAARRPTHIISADTLRIAASEQLRLYAGILGVGFESVETGFALAQALEERSARGIVLIDTPGLSQQDVSDAADIAEFIANDREIDTHLVVPASMRLSDMDGVVERYSIFRPKKLLFTKVDETRCYGPLISLPWKTGLPVSFLTCGQRIPEDLQAATMEQILEMALAPVFACERTRIAVA
jgi:flagellar biosynthesis protein FlhF